MYSCPIVYYHNNLIFNQDRSCWAAYRLKGFDYDLRSEESKDAIQDRLTRFVANIPNEATIHLIPTNFDVDVHIDRQIRNLDPEDPLYDLAVSHANGTREYLKHKYYQEGGVASEYQTYVVVKLESEDQDILAKLSDFYEYFVKDPINVMDTAMGLDARDILQSKIRQSQQLADTFLKDQASRAELSPLDAIETQWLYRRINYRGLKTEVQLRTDVEQYLDGEKPAFRKKSWSPFARRINDNNQAAIRPYQRDIVTLFDGALYQNEKRALRIEHSDGTKSYQGFLAFTHIPDGMENPGCEWLFLLQEYRVSCEICIHVQNIEHRQALKKIDVKKREIKGQIEEVENSNNAVPEDLMDAEENAAAVESELKRYRDPLSRVSITLCFSGETMAEMESKLNYIRGVYTDYNFLLERPLTDQFALYMGMIPGAGRYTADFVLPLPPSTVAGGIFGATRLLGDGIGPYIGTTGPLEQPVHLNLALAPLRNESAAASFYGNLGQGKSFNANLLTYLTILNGGSGLIVCPKGERAHWEEDFKFFKERGLITAITLSPDDKFRGMLDPFVVYRDDVESACALAMNVISEHLMVSTQDDRHTALSECLETMKTEPVRGMAVLADKLANFVDKDNLGLDHAAKKLARQLKAMGNVGLSRLLYGTGHEKGLDFKNRLNILMLQNVKLPSPETPKEDYDAEEKLFTVLMMVMGAFAKQFAMQQLFDSLGRPRFKILEFDESWALGKTPEGVKLYEFLTRMGRSLYSGCIFNGHSVLDVPSEGIKEAIKYKFCFKTDNSEEATRMLRYMGLDVTDENIDRIKGLRNGECLFQDLDKRVGVLRFDVVFEDLARIFSTTPGERKPLPEDALQHMDLDRFDDLDLIEEEI